MRPDAPLTLAAVRRGVFVFAATLCLLLTPPGAARAQCPAPEPLRNAHISHVHDGDSLTLADGRKIRLIGINAPELGGDGRAPEPFARQARDRLRRIFRQNSEVGLLFGPEKKDRYGRWLAHVYDHRGRSVEALLLREGLAWHVAVPPNLGSAQCLALMERQARRSGLGVWRLPPVSAQQIERGGFQRIRGLVENIDFRHAWWLDLDGELTGVIYPEHQHRFDRSALAELAGKPVELQGWVYSGHGKGGKPWRIKVETPYALERLPGP